MLPIWLWVLACLVEGVGCAGTSIFKLGSDIDKKQWDIMGMYFIVFGITIFFELVVHKLHSSVHSDSGKSIVHHITQEIMILGGISAVLVIFENSGGTAVIDAPLFHFVHFVIFVMAIIFIILVSTLFITVERAWEYWMRFENKVIEIESDPSLDFNSRAAFLHQYVQSVPTGQQMLAGLMFFRQNLPTPLSDVSYSRYMMKMQRKIMLHFLDLHGTSWALLAVLCTVAAVVTYITLQVSDNELATIGLWTLFVGLGPLLVLVITFFKIRKEYYRFTQEVLRMRMHGEMRPATNQTQYFWHASPHFMEALLQTMLLYQVFFLATASVNFTYRLINVQLGWLLMFLMFLPSGFVFFLMVPLVLPPLTILSSLGDLLDHETLLKMKENDKTSGKFRRMAQREDRMKNPAPFLKKTEEVMQKFSTSQLEKNAGRMGVVEDGLCVECEAALAVVKCAHCGELCDSCDFKYHKLKVNMHHKRKHFNETDSEGDDPTTGGSDINVGGGAPKRRAFHHRPTPRSLPPLPAYPVQHSANNTDVLLASLTYGRGMGRGSSSGSSSVGPLAAYNPFRRGRAPPSTGSEYEQLRDVELDPNMV